MNKAEREKFRKRASKANHFVTLTKEQLADLLDYVDTLEAAAKETVHYFSPSADVTAKLREALDKGK